MADPHLAFTRALEQAWPRQAGAPTAAAAAVSSRELLGALAAELYPWVLGIERVVLPALLRGARDLKTRVRLSPLCARAYGQGHPERSHSVSLGKLLQFLGRPTPEPGAALLQRLAGLSWHQSLAALWLDRQFGASGAPAIAAALTGKLEAPALLATLFTDHAAHDAAEAREVLALLGEDLPADELHRLAEEVGALATLALGGWHGPAAKPADAFDRELRSLCDSFFEREGMPDDPFGRLLRHQLPLEELRTFYRQQNRWETSLTFNQFTLPALLDRCPDPVGRARLWEVISPEYGEGRFEAAHTALMRGFYLGIGFSEAELPIALDAGNPAHLQAAQTIGRLSFVELLSGRFLGPETVAPKVFGTYVKALKAAYGLPAEAVEFFRFHGEEDKNDSAVLFKLVADYARTAADQEAARRALRAYYDQPRIRAFCAIRPINFSFAEGA